MKSINRKTHEPSEEQDTNIKKVIVAVFICLLFISWGIFGKTTTFNHFPKVAEVNGIAFNSFSSLPSDTLVITSDKTIILTPSKKEIDSLTTLWGEDKFYDIAYDENRKLSRIYGYLDKNNISYIASNKDYLHITKENRIIKKSSLPAAWGVLYNGKNGSYLFKNSIDFLLEME